MITPILALLFWLHAAQQSSDGLVLVTVRSAGRPIANASVRLEQNESLTSATGTDGTARIRIPAGTWTIAVAAPGFGTESVSLRVDAGRETPVEFELRPDVVREDEIIVTAARNDSRLEDQPVRIEVVDREDIEEKALMTPGSVAMLLGETTGLRVQTTAPAMGAANVRIQGLRGRYSQLLSDGLPLYGLQGDSLSLLQVPPLDLGQVEIIKGAASALYGPSALGGVINLVSQRPRARYRELLLNESTQTATDVAFWAVEPPHGNWGFTVLGGLHGQTRQDLDEDGWADLPGFLRGVFRPRLFWENSKGRSVFATVGVMAEDRRGGTLDEGTTPDGSTFREDLDSRRVDAGTVIRIPAGPGRLFTLRGSVSTRSDRHVFGDDVERGRRTTWLGEAVLLGKWGRHNWLIGAAAQQDRYDAVDLPSFDYAFTSPGLFAQDEIDLPENVTLGISARLDRHSTYGTFASPRVSVLYKPLASLTARLSAGTGFFAPTPFIEETEETGLSRVRPFTGIVAERARSASFDTTWDHGPFELVGTIFGSRVNRPLQRRFYDESSVELFNAGGPTRTWGTELLARYRIQEFVIIATHGYTRSTEENPESPGRRQVPLTPDHLVSLNAIEEGDWGRIGVEWYYVGRQPLEDNPYRSTGRSQILFGLLFEKRFGRLRAFVNLENLGNVRQTHWDPLLRPSPLPDGRWTVDAWAPLDGRVINAGVRVPFD